MQHTHTITRLWRGGTLSQGTDLCQYPGREVGQGCDSVHHEKSPSYGIISER